MSDDIKRLLIVDDYPDLAATMGIILTMEGFQVVTATSGSEALNKIAQFDALITDYDMGEISGLVVAAAYRALNSDGPIFMVTGKPGQVTQSQLNELGITLFMKPVDYDNVLIPALKDALSSSPSTPPRLLPQVAPPDREI